MNKKGQTYGLLFLVLAIMVVIVGSIVLAIGTGVLTFVGNTANEITSGLGIVGDTNMSHVSDVSIGVVNGGIQMLKWGSGVLLFAAFILIFMMASYIRLKPNGFMIGLYIIMVIAMVLAAIYMSNTYDSFLNGNDDIANELKSMVLISFLITFMPYIITVIAFIGGIIIFTGAGEEFT